MKRLKQLQTNLYKVMNFFLAPFGLTFQGVATFHPDGYYPLDKMKLLVRACKGMNFDFQQSHDFIEEELAKGNSVWHGWQRCFQEAWNYVTEMDEKKNLSPKELQVLSLVEQYKEDGYSLKEACNEIKSVLNEENLPSSGLIEHFKETWTNNHHNK